MQGSIIWLPLSMWERSFQVNGGVEAALSLHLGRLDLVWHRNPLYRRRYVLACCTHLLTPRWNARNQDGNSLTICTLCIMLGASGGFSTPSPGLG
ncbi:hypothetical protein XELAEV_18007686mg [Xenopus laevis]|uniref:Uncharacterized protein n=1 Tax=Xenopus laevis TaxID=8355 RepID=A0A974E2T9_XENLA|nr:hypothetical protein XELAEV_18007686mg [Xenopus laevis]